MPPTVDSSVAHLRHLESLLDDPSPVVQEALRKEIARLGESGIDWLEALATDLSARSGGIATNLLEEMAQRGAALTFRRYLKGGSLDLETSLILMHRVVAPGLRAREVTAALDIIAERTQDLLAAPFEPVIVTRALNRVFFHEFGFRGEVAAHADPATHLLGDVLALRRGVPLSLALCYRLVAARLGLPLEPVLRGEQCLLGYFRGREPFFVDPHAGGRFSPWCEAQKSLSVAAVGPAHSHWNARWTAIVQLLCAQLRDIYAERDEPESSVLFGQFVEDLGATSEQ